jgi:hypothetical protein
MPRIVIGGQVIDFPNSGSDPNWASGIIAFAQAVAEQLEAIASPFDVPPKVQILTSNSNTNLALEDAIFPTGSVRSFTLYYAIYRVSSTTSITEQGEVSGMYNSDTSTWILTDSYSGDRQATTGLPYHTFSMDGDQLEISTVAIGGTYDSASSTISYSAKTQLETE